MKIAPPAHDTGVIPGPREYREPTTIRSPSIATAAPNSDAAGPQVDVSVAVTTQLAPAGSTTYAALACGAPTTIRCPSESTLAPKYAFVPAAGWSSGALAAPRQTPLAHVPPGHPVASSGVLAAHESVQSAIPVQHTAVAGVHTAPVTHLSL